MRGVVLALVMVAVCGSVFARNVGRCVAPDGSVTLTDQECPTGSAMKEIYQTESSGPGRSAASEQRRALRVYDSIPDRPAPPPSSPAKSAEVETGPKSASCIALLNSKKQIESRMRSGGYSVQQSNRFHAELKSINERRCAEKCIRC